jgi:hypothetical protein
MTDLHSGPAENLGENVGVMIFERRLCGRFQA